MKFFSFLFIGLVVTTLSFAQTSIDKAVKAPGKKRASMGRQYQFKPGALWYDVRNKLMNVHGGGILYNNNKYYWFGEKRDTVVQEGVNVYSTTDLYNWKYEGLALAPNLTDTASDIAKGCLMERPKVIYNAQTGKYVMWFHLELRGKGYSAARVAVAVSNKVTGPYEFIRSFRPNGNMSRDMGLFVDEDGAAYLIYASNENYDLRIAKLNEDYQSVTSQDQLLFNNHREAPALFKYKQHYYLITSGCTGWAPNKATLHMAASLWGPWKEVKDFMSGVHAATTFNGQSTFVLPVAGKKDAFIFIADKWTPKNLKDSRYIWLPIQFIKGQPFIEWKDTWDLNYWNK